MFIVYSIKVQEEKDRKIVMYGNVRSFSQAKTIKKDLAIDIYCIYRIIY